MGASVPCFLLPECGCTVTTTSHACCSIFPVRRDYYPQTLSQTKCFLSSGRKITNTESWDQEVGAIAVISLTM